MAAQDGDCGQGCGNKTEYQKGVRIVELHLPEDEGEGLGFQLTRTLWDPYPWVREVTAGSRADDAGLRTGDCLLQVDGHDILGTPVGQVAGLIRGDGAGRVVSLLAWNCGVDPTEDPELLWSCGGGARGERARRVVARALSALACALCAAAPAPRACRRQHMYCHACYSRLERCALCREPFPPPASPAARNLVADQVFEAIATEYGIKNTLTRTSGSISAQVSPNRSPTASPSPSRRGQYQISLHIKQKKNVHFTDKRTPNYASDPNIHRSCNSDVTPNSSRNTSTNSQSTTQNGPCSCTVKADSIPKINVESVECLAMPIQHKLVARLRQACSLADLQNAQVFTCPVTGSLNNINAVGDGCSASGNHGGSLDNLKSTGSPSQEAPVFILPAPPIYLLSCGHEKTQ